MDDSTLTFDSLGGAPKARSASVRVALVLVWSAREPHRVGEVLLLPTGKSGVSVILGRGPGSGGLEMRITPCRQRPGQRLDTGPIADQGISRTQLRLTPRADDKGVHVENLGRCQLIVDGAVVDSAEVALGGTLLLRNAQLWLCVQRPAHLPAARTFPEDEFPVFGQADAIGLVGESQVAWRLREQVAFLAGRHAHVLVRGDSGAGKELVAHGVHALSARSGRALVARNAATIPSSLVDAELFGNVKDYPNPGMADRPGLLGEADGGTLFLDEIAEVPPEVHAHLLRVLDGDGEYHRLGEARARRSDFRLVAATNRGPEAIKHDLLARLKLRIVVPGLGERPEDVPLILRHLLRRSAGADPLVARFFRDGYPLVAPELVAALIGHGWTHHVRELEVLLWRSIGTSLGDRLELTPEVREELRAVQQQGSQVLDAVPLSVDPRDLTVDQVRAALEQHDWVVKDTWKALGLRNRFQLMRLMRKHDLKRPG